MFNGELERNRKVASASEPHLAVGRQGERYLCLDLQMGLESTDEL